MEKDGGPVYPNAAWRLEPKQGCHMLMDGWLLVLSCGKSQSKLCINRSDLGCILF